MHYCIEALIIKLTKVILERSIESKSDILDIHPIIERNIAAYIDVEDLLSRQICPEVVRQGSEDPGGLSRVVLRAFRTVAMDKKDRFHCASPLPFERRTLIRFRSVIGRARVDSHVLPNQKLLQPIRDSSLAEKIGERNVVQIV